MDVGGDGRVLLASVFSADICVAGEDAGPTSARQEDQSPIRSIAAVIAGTTWSQLCTTSA